MSGKISEKAALARLFDVRVTPEMARQESPLEKLQALEDYIRELEEPVKNPLQTNFGEFLKHCWTKDEARGGNVAKIPDWPLLTNLAEDLVQCPKLFIEKSRRVLASWTVCCFDIWIAAGGQDPRWPVLMNATGNRQVFLAARQFDQANWFLFERVKFIVDESLKRGLRKEWPDFPSFRWKEGLAQLSNGSRISAVAQGADQLRGPGATLHHWEEIAFWEQAKQTVEGSLPTIRGGGHIIAITTPNAASYAVRIVKGSIRNGGW